MGSHRGTIGWNKSAPPVTKPPPSYHDSYNKLGPKNYK
jgi:hypothetical protein